MLHPDQLGYYNAIQNSGNYINMMSSLGTPIVIQRVGARTRELGAKAVSEIFSNAFTLYLLINALSALVLIIFPDYFFDLLLDSQGSVNHITLVSVIVILNALGQIPLYLILGLEEFKKYSLRNLLSNLIALFVAVIFIMVMDDNLKASFYGLVVSFFINAVLTGLVFYKVIRKYSFKIQLKLRYGVLKKVMEEGLIYYIGNTFLGAIAGLVIISLFFNHLSAFDYGFTRIGNAFAVILSIVPSAIQPVTISLLSVENARNIYIKSLQIRLIPFFSTLMLVVVSFNMELMLGLLFGETYIGAKDIVFGMILVQIPNIYLGLINNYQVGVGHLNFVGSVAIAGSAAMIGSALYLMPMFGIKGYFASIYIATIFSLSLVAFREYFRTGQLTRTDWNSVILIGGLIILSYAVMYLAPNYLRIPFTLLIITTASYLFWKYCMVEAEKQFILMEARRRGIHF